MRSAQHRPAWRDWLGETGRLVPNHKTIADFRHDNGPAIRKTCAQFVELCRRIGTLKGDCVAIDGSKFKAVNNRDRNFTKGTLHAQECSVIQFPPASPVTVRRSEYGGECFLELAHHSLCRALIDAEGIADVIETHTAIARPGHLGQAHQVLCFSEGHGPLHVSFLRRR